MQVHRLETRCAPETFQSRTRTRRPLKEMQIAQFFQSCFTYIALASPRACHTCPTCIVCRCIFIYDVLVIGNPRSFFREGSLSLPLSFLEFAIIHQYSRSQRALSPPPPSLSLITRAIRRCTTFPCVSRPLRSDSARFKSNRTSRSMFHVRTVRET